MTSLIGGFSRALGFRQLLFIIDRRRLLGGVLSMYVRIHHSDRPISLIGGYQGMFVSVTMIYRLSLLGELSKYICIYHNDGPTSLIGGGGVLSRALEFRPSLIGELSKHVRIYHNDGPTSLIGGGRGAGGGGGGVI